MKLSIWNPWTPRYRIVVVTVAVSGLVESSLDHSVVSTMSSLPLPSSSFNNHVPLAKLVLSLDGRAAKLQALRHLLTTLQIVYARFAVMVFCNFVLRHKICLSSLTTLVKYTLFISPVWLFMNSSFFNKLDRSSVVSLHFDVADISLCHCHFITKETHANDYVTLQ